MKHILSLSILLISTKCFTQTILPEKDGKVVYENIDTIVGLTKNDIYNKSKLWLVNSFKSAKDVLQIDDKENGQLIGKGNFDYSFTWMLHPTDGVCYFTIKIDCRDNKARITLYDILASNGGDDFPIEYWNGKYIHSLAKKMNKAIDDEMKRMLIDFKSNLEKKENDNF